MMRLLATAMRVLCLLMLSGAVAFADDASPESASPMSEGGTNQQSNDVVDAGDELEPTVPEQKPKVSWTSLLPPLLAIGLAILLQDVLVALFVAIWVGSILITWESYGWMSPIYAVSGAIEILIRDCLVEPGSSSHTHLTIVFFTLFLGSMVGVLYAGGGMETLVHKISRFASNRRRGQLTTTALGGVIFFDDYANTMLLGSTMRPVTDRLRISREKLAFLVDSTAAPIAGLALISTWVGFEVQQIRDAMQEVADSHGHAFTPDAYSVFLQTIVYRFYPILLLGFVVLVSWTGRDFGPMLAAERKALKDGSTPPKPTPALESHASHTNSSLDTNRAEASIWLAIIPIAVLCGSLAWGMYSTGTQGLAATNLDRQQSGDALLPVNLANTINNADSNSVMLLSAFLASMAAVICVVVTRRMRLAEATGAWVEGAKGMVMPISILVLAWGVAFVCAEEQLNTAEFLKQTVGETIDVKWMPAIAFILAAAVSFSTGTSWGTMAILIPLVTNLSYNMLLTEGGTTIDVALSSPPPVILATIGAVLAGAIFGDHCSPISDTTVLSSAASGCDHLKHVTTQMPYAISVGAISLVFGYLPVGFGLDVKWSMLASAIALVLLVVYLGQRSDSQNEFD